MRWETRKGRMHGTKGMGKVDESGYESIGRREKEESWQKRQIKIGERGWDRMGGDGIG